MPPLHPAAPESKAAFDRLVEASTRLEATRVRDGHPLGEADLEFQNAWKSFYALRARSNGSRDDP